MRRPKRGFPHVSASDADAEGHDKVKTEQGENRTRNFTQLDAADNKTGSFAATDFLEHARAKRGGVAHAALRQLDDLLGDNL